MLQLFDGDNDNMLTLDEFTRVRGAAAGARRGEGAASASAAHPLCCALLPLHAGHGLLHQPGQRRGAVQM